MGEEARPRLLLLGARGQVGGELARALAPLGEITPLDRAAVDLSDAAALRAAVRECSPQVILNAAAYTEVDRAETEPAVARRINGDAPEVLAAEAARTGALLVHYSTDYVFDGTGSQPYTERDVPGPHTAYGVSKLAGDEAVLASAAEAYIFRVGWVYGRRGRNFLNTMLWLAGERDELRVVADQHGGPTWSRAIAGATSVAVGKWLAARRLGDASPRRGVYHLAPPDYTTWHGFATAIVEAMTLPEGKTRPRVTAVTSAEYPTLAKRPAWSVLDGSLLRDTFGIELPAWRTQLARCLADSP